MRRVVPSVPSVSSFLFPFSSHLRALPFFYSSEIRRQLSFIRDYNVHSIGGSQTMGCPLLGKRFFATASDPYSVLNVEKTASQADIKKAYYKMAKQFHPDTNPGDKAAAKRFQEVNAAYEILGNDEKRKQFDTYGSVGDMGGDGGSPFGNVDPRDIFSQFESQFGSVFGDLFGGPRQQRQQRGADIDATITIPFMDAANGTTREVKVTRQKACVTCSGSGAEKGTKPQKCTKCKGTGYATIQQGPYVLSTVCPKCQGQGQSQTNCKSCNGEGCTPEKATVTVQVPAGVANGQSLRLSYQGSAARGGVSPGHLWVHVNVEPHSVFQRDEFDIHVYTPIPLSMSCLGGVVVVPTLTGDVDLKVPAGSRSGDKLLMRNKGIIKPTGAYGHQYIHLDIEVPKKLTPRQIELMEEFKKEEQSNPPRLDKPASWFQRFKDLLSKRDSKSEEQ